MILGINEVKKGDDIILVAPANSKVPLTVKFDTVYTIDEIRHEYRDITIKELGSSVGWWSINQFARASIKVKFNTCKSI
jgi:hypothetical protein